MIKYEWYHLIFVFLAIAVGIIGADYIAYERGYEEGFTDGLIIGSESPKVNEQPCTNYTGEGHCISLSFTEIGEGSVNISNFTMEMYEVQDKEVSRK